VTRWRGGGYSESEVETMVRSVKEGCITLSVGINDSGELHD
jgi:hypothetical protein